LAFDAKLVNQIEQICWQTFFKTNFCRQTETDLELDWETKLDLDNKKDRLDLDLDLDPPFLPKTVRSLPRLGKITNKGQTGPPFVLDQRQKANPPQREGFPQIIS
jgi:hypothetical protein